MKKSLKAAAIFLFLIPFIVHSQDFEFQDPNLLIEERIENLVSEMTLEEKAGQLRYDAPAIPRLGIPAYNWWSECLHGVARNGRATVFPQAIGMAATFDTDLIYRVASAIADEGRAKYNITSAKGYRDIYQGLTFWTPNVNIFRDPRWGRGQETYGEDPFLTSQIGVAFVKGLQGDHPKYVKAAACAKHYAVHNGPEALRHEFDAVVSKQDLWDTYLPAFQALVVDAKVEGVMGAYNRTNGDPMNAHQYLMKDVLRERWGFDGYYVTDCWALVDFYRGHNVVGTPEEAAAMALKHGANLNCGSTYQSILSSVEQGFTTEEDIDHNLRELLGTRFRLGLFDPPGTVPFDKIGAEVIRSEKHVKLAHETAVKSIVLLKNENQTLPLSKDLQKIFVTGPTATHMQALLANYYGVSEDMKTILEGIVGEVGPSTSVMYRQGALLDRPNVNPRDWFSGEAANSDVTIACLGISQLIEGEEGESIASPHLGDRVDIGLPASQVEFLRVLHEKAQKLVVVLTAGSAIAIPEVYDMADAILYIWYPGEQGGAAVADVLFGDEVPSGRLPVSFVKSVEDLPPYEDYNMIGRTYRFMEKEALFPFGFGLSYTTFEYNDLKFSSERIKRGESLSASISLINTGSFEAEEVVQLYITDVESSTRVPNHALKGFQRVILKPGESKEVSFEVTPDLMEIVNDEGERIIEKGEFKVLIGGSSPSPRNPILGAAPQVSGVFTVR